MTQTAPKSDAKSAPNAKSAKSAPNAPKPVTVTKPGEEPIVVDASTFVRKPASVQREIAAELAYTELLDPETRDDAEPHDVIEMLIAEVKAGNIPDPQVQSWVANILNDDAKGVDAKQNQRKKFGASLRRYQPKKSRAGAYAGQKRSQLKERIAELEAQVSQLEATIAELQNK